LRKKIWNYFSPFFTCFILMRSVVWVWPIRYFPGSKLQNFFLWNLLFHRWQPHCSSCEGLVHPNVLHSGKERWEKAVNGSEYKRSSLSQKTEFYNICLARNIRDQCWTTVSSQSFGKHKQHFSVFKTNIQIVQQQWS
jgi:hypothetical protein